MTTPEDIAFRLAVGGRIRDARSSRGLKAKAVAKEVGLGSAAALYAYETGRRLPAPRQIALLASVLAVSADWLLCGTDTRHVAPLLVTREDEAMYTMRLEQWEGCLAKERCEFPPLFDSFMILPEVARVLYELRRGRPLSDAGFRSYQESTRRRWERFQQAEWHIYDLCSKVEVEAFVGQIGAYDDERLSDWIDPQIEKVVDILETYPLRVHLRFTPLTFRFAYRVYDCERVILNSVSNYLVVEDEQMVQRFHDEFRQTWLHNGNEANAIRYLRGLLQQRKKPVRARRSVRAAK